MKRSHSDKSIQSPQSHNSHNSHTNPKNRLQEYCQKNKLSSPIYDSYEDYEGFNCTATIVVEQKTITGLGSSVKKKTAEKRAASKILQQLKKLHQSKIQIISRKDIHSDEYIAIYLDMENINVNELTQLFSIYKYDPTQFLFIGCLSTGHHYAQTDFNFDGIAFQKVLVPSTRSDAADIGMIMHALTYNIQNGCCDPIPASEVVFVSRDRFSCVFIELANKNFATGYSEGSGPKLFHCSCVEELKSLLNKPKD